MRWNFQRRTDLWKFNNQVTREAGGEDCAWLGMIGGELLYNSNRFIDLQGILPEAAIVMLDHQRRNPYDGFEQNTEAGKRLHEVAGWDKLIPESMPQYQLGAPAFRLASMPKPEVRLWATSGFAGGIQPWWHHIGSMHEDRRQYTTAEPIFTWHEENQDLLVDRELRADVGVVWTQQNHDYFGRADAADKTMAPYRGAVKALNRAGITYVPLHADEIAEAFERLKVIILPNMGGLSDAQVAGVEAFVAAGGSVIATGETSIASEYGDPRGDFALGALFGVHRGEGEPGRDRRHQQQHRDARAAQLPSPGARAPRRRLRLARRHRPAPEGKRHPILAGLEEADTLPFGGYLPVVSVDAGTEVLATFIPDFPIYPPETSWMREPRSDFAAITVADARRRAASSSGSSPTSTAASPATRPSSTRSSSRTRCAGRSATGSASSLKGTHGIVTADLYEQPGRHVLHLNNRLLLSRVPGRQYDLVPVGPIEVRLRLGAAAPESVRLRVAGTRVPACRDGDTLVFSVDRLLDHELVEIGA